MITCPHCNMSIDEGIRFCPRCGSNVETAKSPPADPFIGRKIKDNFLILELIGEGGMGKVYKAEQISLGKTVCMKILHQNMAGDPNVAKRFHREARAASRLNHPNSINIIDFGTAEDGSLFMAMEYVEGVELGKVIEKEFPLPPERIVKILSQVCSALAEAHEHKVIHRDLKPENILIEKRRDGEDFVKVLDFGIAKVMDPQEDEIAGANLTRAGMVCGTPEYISPEQARGEELDPRSDIYSLGVILYQMLTGDIPFHAPTSLGIVTKHILEAPTPPSQVKPGVPAPLEAVCMRALKKDKNNRQSSALEFKAELEAALEAIKIGAPVAGKPVPLPGQARASEQTSGEPAPGDTGEAPFPTMKSEGEPPVVKPVTGEVTVPQTEPSFTDEEPIVVPVPGKKKKKIILFSAAGTLAVALALGLFFGLSAGGGDEHVTKTDVSGVNGGGKAGQTGAATGNGRVTSGDSKQGEVNGSKNGQPSHQAGPADATAGNQNASKNQTTEKAAKPIKKKGRKGGKKKTAFSAKSARQYYEKGNELFLQGKIEEALQQYKNTIRRNKRFANAYKKVGICYMKLQKIKQAKAYFKKYLRLRPRARDMQQIRNLVEQLEKFGQ